jgi:hypothetical protein
MYSNFITPPDIVESVLVINATEEQIQACATTCENSTNTYNVYFYHEVMNRTEWLATVCGKVETVLINRTAPTDVTLVGIDATHYFGPDEEFKEPAEYFNK